MTLGFRILGFALAFLAAVVLVIFVIGADPAALTPLLYVFTVAAWVQTLVLGRAGFGGPRIGALDERTFVGFVIAMFGTTACLIVYNTDHGRALFGSDAASVLYRLSVLAVLVIPTIWLVLWALGRLGEKR